MMGSCRSYVKIQKTVSTYTLIVYISQTRESIFVVGVEEMGFAAHRNLSKFAMGALSA